MMALGRQGDRLLLAEIESLALSRNSPFPLRSRLSGMPASDGHGGSNGTCR